MKRRVKKKGKRLLFAYALRAAVLLIGISAVFFGVTALTGNKDKENEAHAVVETPPQADDIWETEGFERLTGDFRDISIMIDPGHGGDDPGTMSETLDERDVTLAIALMARDYLKECNVNVLMTREDDTFINKYDRAELANEKNVDYFVSIHCNYLEDNPEISGVETYYMKNSGSGKEFAEEVHRNILAVTGANDMYVRENDYVVIKNTSMPAILIETGYLSNKEDEEKLSDESYRKKMAYAIAKGIVEYLQNKDE